MVRLPLRAGVVSGRQNSWAQIQFHPGDHNNGSRTHKPGSNQQPTTPSKLMVLVVVQGKMFQGLLDSSCSRRVVQTSMVRGDNTPKHTICPQCRHGDVKTYPSQQLQLTVGAHAAVVTAAPDEKLAYPVNIGRDLPFFWLVVNAQARTVGEDPSPSVRVPQSLVSRGKPTTLKKECPKQLSRQHTQGKKR